jgi:dienelactone hydrolase
MRKAGLTSALARGVRARATLIGLALALLSFAAAGDSIPLEAFATLGNLRDPVISPGGDHIAYRVPYQGKDIVVVHRIDDSTNPTLIPPPDQGFLKWFAWGNDERVVVSYGFTQTLRYINGYLVRGGSDLEQTRLFSFHRDGSDVRKPVRLVRPDPGCKQVGSRLRGKCSEPIDQDNVIDWMAEDDRYILVEVDGNFDGESEVRRVDLNNGRFKVIRSGAPDIHWWVTDSTHEVRFGYGTGANGPVGQYRMPTGKWRDVTDTPWFRAEFRPQVFEPDPRYAIAVGLVDGNTRGVVRLDLVEDRIDQVLHHDPNYDVFPKFNQQEMIGYYVPALNGALTFTDPQWQALQEAPRHAFPDQQVRFLTWTEDRQTLLVEASSDVDAGTVYVWDRGAGKMYQLGRTYPELEPGQLAPMEEVTYKARDGLEIGAYLTIPKGAVRAQLPVVVMPHGGPFARDTWGFDFLVQMLASRGYAVLQPNFRGSEYQGREFQEAGEGEWGRKMQDDLTDGVHWLMAEGIADPDRICIVGWSYGGYAALMGVIKSPDLYACAASINGVADLKRLRGRYSYDRYWRQQIDELLGVDRSTVDDYSPVSQAERVTAPVLIVHARDDGRVPFEHGETMARRLQAAERDVTMIEIAHGDHGLWNGDSRLQMLTALERFLSDHLGSGGDRG